GCDHRTLDPFRILFQSPATLSQAQSSLPAIRAIKAGRPDSFLAIVTTSPLTSFWEEVSDVDQVITSRESFWPAFLETRFFRRFDAAIIFSTSLSRALGLCLAGIPIRVGPG